MGHANIELLVWFRRRGYLKDGLIVYDHDRKEVNENVMARQAVLNAGSLVGKLRLSNIERADIEILEQNIVNDPRYVELSKRIVDIVYPPIKTILNMLQINYGQYWIRSLEPWDARKYSLAHYCSTILELQWSTDGEHTWHNFEQDKEPITIQATLPSDETYHQYLSLDDYKSIQDFINRGYSPSLAATTLASAHRIFDQGNLKHTLIEARTALELALPDFYRSKLSPDPELAKHIQSFWELPLKAQLLALAPSLQIDSESLKQAIKAIKMRNDVVHEGWSPPNNADTLKTISDFLKLISLFIEGPKFKFPENP